MVLFAATNPRLHCLYVYGDWVYSAYCKCLGTGYIANRADNFWDAVECLNQFAYSDIKIVCIPFVVLIIEVWLDPVESRCRDQIEVPWSDWQHTAYDSVRWKESHIIQSRFELKR